MRKITSNAHLNNIATVLGIQTKNFNLDEKGVEKIPTPTNGGVQLIYIKCISAASRLPANVIPVLKSILESKV